MKLNRYDDIIFCSHCDPMDNPECDLGVLEYTCPVCNKYQHNYDDWSEGHTITQIVCDDCKSIIEIEDR